MKFFPMPKSINDSESLFSSLDTGVQNKEKLLDPNKLIEHDCPEHFICPLSNKIMTNPVSIKTLTDKRVDIFRHTYDKKSIDQWFETNEVNPKNQLEVDSREDNKELKNEIENFLKDHLKNPENFIWYEKWLENRDDSLELGSDNEKFRYTVDYLIDDKIPEHYFCCISDEIMSDPIDIITKQITQPIELTHTYDKTSIDKWLETNSLDPKNNLRIESNESNVELKVKIETFFENSMENLENFEWHKDFLENPESFANHADFAKVYTRLFPSQESQKGKCSIC